MRIPRSRSPKQLFISLLVLSIILVVQYIQKTYPQDLSILGIAISPTPTVSPIYPSGTMNELYKVVKVADGDTIAVEIHGKAETIRLIGINTPEVVDPRKPVECFGKEASSKAKDVLLGKNVFLESDSTQGERDRYGRLLRYAFLEDKMSFNKMMISEGYAYEYTYKYPYKYQVEYKEAEKTAREGNKGLWNESLCKER